MLFFFCFCSTFKNASAFKTNRSRSSHRRLYCTNNCSQKFCKFYRKAVVLEFRFIISCKPEAKGKFAQTSKSIKTSWTWLSAKILLLFMSLLTTLIVKNSHILARTFFNFLKKCPTPKLKGFQYQIWTSVKKPGK